MLREVTVPVMEVTAPVMEDTVPAVEVTVPVMEVMAPVREPMVLLKKATVLDEALTVPVRKATHPAEQPTQNVLNPLVKLSSTLADLLSLIILDLTAHQVLAIVDLALAEPHVSDQALEVVSDQAPEVVSDLVVAEEVSDQDSADQAPEETASIQDLDLPSVATRAHLARHQPLTLDLSQSQTWKQRPSSPSITKATHSPQRIVKIATMAPAFSVKHSRLPIRLLISNNNSRLCRIHLPLSSTHKHVTSAHLRLMTSHPRLSSAWDWVPRSVKTS